MTIQDRCDLVPLRMHHRKARQHDVFEVPVLLLDGVLLGNHVLGCSSSPFSSSFRRRCQLMVVLYADLLALHPEVVAVQVNHRHVARVHHGVDLRVAHLVEDPLPPPLPTQRC